jgi:hypothetical protein
MNLVYSICLILFLLFPGLLHSQYTDVINSNRPGLSVGAYAVGKNVWQLESGLFFEQQDHNLLNTQSNLFGTDLALRYGLLFEALEVSYEGTFQNQNITYVNLDFKDSRTNFSRNRLGLKYLLYDRYKDPERNKPNLYSWKANYGFKFRNLIPSVALYAGANFVFGDNPFYIEDPIVSPKAMIITQSRLTPRFVLITNIAYDRIGTDFPEWSYLLSLSHAFRNPKWSVFVENQGLQSDRYADILLRSGVAHLIADNLQADINLGASFKNTPSRIFVSAGVSYRLDFHKDPVRAIEDQDAGENGGAIKKNSIKKQSRRQDSKGSGAEDIHLGPSKKQLRALTKKQKKAKKDDGVIDF